MLNFHPLALHPLRDYLFPQNASKFTERLKPSRMDGTCLELAGKATLRPSPMSEVDELSLIRRAQEGDRSAFDSLVRLYDQNVLRLALQVVGSPEEARDLYQEAFLKVYRSIGQFRREAKFSTWLYRVVMNVCLDHLRRQKTRREVPAPWWKKARRNSCKPCGMSGLRLTRSAPLTRGKSTGGFRWHSGG